MCYSQEEHWIRDTLSNDEYSTDAELITYFTENGLSKEVAEKRVAERSKYLNNIVLCDDAPSFMQFHPNCKVMA